MSDEAEYGQMAEWQEGVKAAKRGKPRISNPYHSGTTSYLVWDLAWTATHDNQRELNHS